MLNIFITLLTFVLIIITLFMMLVILMQRPNTNAGMGAAFGGGVTESTFGAETTNVLTRATKWSAGGFFLVAIVLYMLYLINEQPIVDEGLVLPTLTASEEATTAGDDPAAAAIKDALTAAVEKAPETVPATDPVTEEPVIPAPSGE